MSGITTAALLAGGSGVAAGAALGLILWWQTRQTNDQAERARQAERRADALQVKLLAAETDVARLEVLKDAKHSHSDPIVNKWFAKALGALPGPMARAIRDAMRADRERGVHENDHKDSPDRDPVPLPPPPEDSFITGPLS